MPAARIAAVLAAAALMAGCASTGAVPRPFPRAGTPQDEQSSDRVEETRDYYALVGTALALRGVPYLNGGADPQGFDCSGFTQYVYAQYGIVLPREVRDQFREGEPVNGPDLVPGDLLFFTTVAPGPTHVAIAIGGDQFVHAPSSRGVVRVERLSAAYWSTRYLGARRIGSDATLP